jgi:phosphoserine phosphatase RsbU/P
MPNARIYGLDYHGSCECANETTGNFYDLIPLGKDCLMLGVGNLAATSDGRAVTVSCLQALLRGSSMRDSRIADIASQVNQTMHLLDSGGVCELFYAAIYPERRLIQYVNAGAEAALLISRRERAVRRLECISPILGLSDRTLFRQAAVTIEPGDVLVAFSEGVAEAYTDCGKGFPDHRILEAVLRNPNAGAAELTRILIQETPGFPEGRRSGKDRTVVVVRFLRLPGEVIVRAETPEEVLAAVPN